MTDPPYAIARAVAPKVRKHLAAHRAARDGLRNIAPEPGVEEIEAMIDAGFWASLRREEGQSPTISLAWVPPAHCPAPLIFERPLPLAPEALTRLAPAVERPGVHLGVWRDRTELRVWGAARTLPPFCLVLEVIAPGVLVVKHSPEEGGGKFANVALLEGDQVKVLDQEASPLGVDSLATADGHSGVLVRLAVSMRAHGHGGTLLLVPPRSEAWLESMVHPIRYSVAPIFSRLADVVRDHPEDSQTLRRAIDGVAGLTAVDGVTVITDQFEVLAFGAMIGRRAGGAEVERVIVSEPVEGSAPHVVLATQLGGTRHLSAAQFVHDQRDAFSLVASKDGRFSVFAWSRERALVGVHRVEALLL